MSIYWDEDSYNDLQYLLNAHASGSGRTNIMTYVADHADANFPDPDEEQSVIDAVDDLLVPQSAEEWLSHSVDSGLTLLQGAAESIPDIFSNPTLASEAQAIAKSIAGIQFAANIHFTVEAI